MLKKKLLCCAPMQAVCQLVCKCRFDQKTTLNLPGSCSAALICPFAWSLPVAVLVALIGARGLPVEAAVTTARSTLALLQSAPVIEHGASQEFPDIADKRIVWQDARTGPTDIFMRDLVGGEPVNITQSADWEVQPDIDGTIIIWKDGYHGIGIHGVDLTTSAVFTVTSGQRDISRPRLSGKMVVWADNRAGDTDWNIYGYDLAHATEFVITAAPGNQVDPQIDGSLVVWWDYQERIYLYNLATQQQQTLLHTNGARLPDVSAQDQLVVWQDKRNGDWDLYGYDLQQQSEVALLVAPRDQEYAVIDQGLLGFQSRTEGSTWNIHLLDLASRSSFAVDPHSGAQTQPALAQNRLVWQDMRYHTADIFSFVWEGEIPSPVVYPVVAPTTLQAGALPDGAIRLQWEDQADGENGFVIERSQGITGVQWVDLVQLPANRTTYTDQPSQLAESYWYRVRAYNAKGASAYSNESFNTTFAATPDAAERYLMVLINEARAAPGVFGYPELAPVPPLAYNPLLAYTAHAHSQAILNSTYQFGHCDPSGRCPSERARAVGYTHGCAENLTTTFQTGSLVMEDANQGFLDSEGHRNNMLAADLNEFGVGHTFDPAKGDSRHGQVTEVFCGRPSVIPPVLPTGAVTPFTGDTTTAFTYVVNFYSASGQAPTQAQVVIDAVPHAMALSTGSAAHGTYRYTTTLLTAGTHTYFFQFAYGNGQTARWPESGEVRSPIVDGETGRSLQAIYLPVVVR